MELEKVLGRIDGRGYKAYKDLKGLRWKVRNFEFTFKKIQGDPFAPPSVVEVRLPIRGEGLPVEDLLHRVLWKVLRRHSRKRGEGKGGLLALPKPSNAMLRRSSVKASGEVRARIWVGLPSRRRRVLADEALEMLTKDLPRALEEGLKEFENRREEHERTYNIYMEIRKKLEKLKLISFVADGSVLPRACSSCEEPLEGAVPFESPSSLRIEVETSYGTIAGMGLKVGIVSITGPAFHGKTTLLEAIARGIWPHVPGDGRERVVTREDAFYVRSEDGRRVSCVDISTFLNLKNSECFNTEDASGATSAASTLQESVEGGSRLLLLDEDYTATNFLYFDDRLKGLYDVKTVYTISEKLKSMKEKGLSMIVVASGSAPILAQSDAVIYMKNYLPHDITSKANKISVEVEAIPYEFPRERELSYKAPEKVKVRGPWLESKEWRSPIRTEANIHLVEEGQLEFLARLLQRPFRGRARSAKVPDPWDLCTSPGCSEVRTLDYLFVLNRSEGLRARLLGSG
ncbi:ABC transporter ATPase [Ignicoccus pacificus DSM 13166]|uniref:ABC transporter ATPase n=1 Tax=Ignicoccus pacificus DSM 13166 TaxID=940294 RepID=A0A977K980_9CREN|nr:ABC transporter ATPase [Ignicoccus pacificus DSM 13166]